MKLFQLKLNLNANQIIKLNQSKSNSNQKIKIKLDSKFTMQKNLDDSKCTCVLFVVVSAAFCERPHNCLMTSQLANGGQMNSTIATLFFHNFWVNFLTILPAFVSTPFSLLCFYARAGELTSKQFSGNFCADVTFVKFQIFLFSAGFFFSSPVTLVSSVLLRASDAMKILFSREIPSEDSTNQKLLV